MHYWLLKSEPSVFSVDDLAHLPKQTTLWEGVRNYQARNFMRAMRVGDLGFFYHSNANPSGIVGIVKVVRAAYPDPTAFDPKSKYYDPKSTVDAPRWVGADVTLIKKFPRMLSLKELKQHAVLKEMMLFHASRLSVQPVTERDWKFICGLV